MNLSAIYHRALDNWCYALDLRTLHIRLQTASLDALAVEIHYGDPFEWQGKTWKCQSAGLRLAGNDGLHDIWEIEIRPEWKRCRYSFLITGRDGTWQYGEQGLQAPLLVAGHPASEQLHKNSFSFPFICPGDLFAAPPWVADTVWYQIFPERFRRGGDQPAPRDWHRGAVTNHERYGGNLRGIIDTLDHVAGLGCNGIYITPVFMAPSAHKYDTTDYFTIDPAFGSNEELKELVAACHRRGIKVILDAVFNHSGTKFAPWLDILAHGKDSKYADWFCVRSWEPLEFDSFAFWKGMPKLNTANPEVKEYLLNVARFWIEEADIDGWRLDVANEIDHEFWRAFRQVVKAAKPEAYIVGEVWHDSMRWLRGDQFDAVMNYRYGDTISDFVTKPGAFPTARSWFQAMDAIDLSYPLPVIRAAFNVLDSHDTDRLITRSGGDRARARLAWFVQFLQKGSPCVYYGSEIGLEGGQDPDNRRLMVWDEAHQDTAQLQFFKQLITMRHQWAGLINQGRRRWHCPVDQPHLGGGRIEWGEHAAGSGGAAATALVWMLNRSEQAASPAAWQALEAELGGSSGWRTLMEADGPWGWKLLVRE